MPTLLLKSQSAPAPDANISVSFSSSISSDMNSGVTSVEIVSPTSSPRELTNSSLIFQPPHFLFIRSRKGTVLFTYCLGLNQKPSKSLVPSFNSCSVIFLKSDMTILLKLYLTMIVFLQHDCKYLSLFYNYHCAKKAPLLYLQDLIVRDYLACSC